MNEHLIYQMLLTHQFEELVNPSTFVHVNIRKTNCVKARKRYLVEVMLVKSGGSFMPMLREHCKDPQCYSPSNELRAKVMLLG